MLIYMETTTKPRTNAYPGRCINCGTTVQPGEGSLSGKPGAWVTAHLVCPEAAPSAPTTATSAFDPQSMEIGVYVQPDGTIVKVQPNKAKTYVYAKRWIEINGERLRDADETRVNGEWEYDRGLLRTLGNARKMTLDEAKAFILRYGRCVRCGRHLKAAESVERGIGPVCINYFGGF